ncbi:hypothetical protein [uncultured Fibrobacter sp.]|uniref:hypothetical protein n=1 Tax=uncultured Fibrobacter sp. TaxID=261512 RepID=UPI0025FA2602|nr:hypothetical protein [uncultured Fibrobacter sp.]
MRLHFVRIVKYSALFLLMAGTCSFAVPQIDCIDYEGNPSSYCKYSRIESSRRFNLYTMDEGVQVKKDAQGLPTNSRRNVDFYVYAPKADNDSLEIVLKPDTAVVNMMKVNSLDSGFRWFGITASYPVFNIPVGTSVSLTGDPEIVAYYNFYAPAIQYCWTRECDSVVTQASDLNMDVGESATIFARAYIPVGPDSGATDSTLEKSFYFSTQGAGDNLQFQSLAGEKLPERKGLGIQLDFTPEDHGIVGFVVMAVDTGRTDPGEAFKLSGYPESFDDKGNATFIVNGIFPGKLTINDRNLPHLDSAAVFDTDGDGIGDKISAWFSGDRDSVVLTDFAYSWPDQDNFGKWHSYKDEQGKAGKLKTEMDFESLNMSASGNDALGALKVAVQSQFTGIDDTLRTDLIDHIGAVIQTASILYGEDDSDILIIKFNKDIDTSWNKGKGFVLNGKEIAEEAIEKNGDEWRFKVDKGVVKVGDMIRISIDGGIQAADGNKTGKNREVPVRSAGGIYATNENNGFYDRNGDGTMDSASIGFLSPLTDDDLKTTSISLYWLDSKSEVHELKFKNLDSLLKKGVISLSEDRTIIGFDLDDSKYDIKKMLTDIDSTNAVLNKAYGYAKMTNTISIAGHKDSTVTTMLGMHDRMSPVISGTFLSPESFQKATPDVFTVTFTEPVDTNAFELSKEDLAFYVDGKWVHYGLGTHSWSNNGKTLKLFLEAGVDLSDRMNPADSVKFSNYDKSFTDLEGNCVREEAPTVMVEGDPRVIVKTTALATLERAVLLADKAAFTERFVEEDVRMDSEMKKSLGVLLDIGFSTIMKSDTAGGAELDLEKIGLRWELDVFTNLGGYVANASGDIRCSDKSFGENCFENARKLYLRWNMRSNNGRKVGVGVYVAKLRVKVYGAKESFKVERIYNWGIRAGSDGMTLGE